jgi:hypothetical protein
MILLFLRGSIDFDAVVEYFRAAEYEVSPSIDLGCATRQVGCRIILKAHYGL